MRTTNPSPISFSIATLTAVMVAAIGISLRAQEATPIPIGGVQITGQPEDWTHHHVVFSNPGTEEEAIRNGTHEEWVKIVNDPRYVLHQLRRRLPVEGPAREDVAIRMAQMAETRAMPERPILLNAKPVGPIQFGSIRANPPRFMHRPTAAMKADWQLLLGDGAVTANAYPAKYSFNPIGTPNCATDYVVYPTGSVGATTQATVVAFNNIYSGCTANPPSVYWAYNTGTGADVTTSPVLSLDGTKVAFVQTTSTAASLVVLKFKSSTTQSVTAPGTPTMVSNITACTAPCMTVTPFATVPDTYSSPYYDYAHDTIFVSDDSSDLFKITGVFNGTATPPFTGIVLNLRSVVKIFSPVYDSVSGCVFVGGGGGFAYSVNSGFPGTVCTSTTFSVFGRTVMLGNGTNNGIVDTPLVDSTAKTVYMFVTAGSSVFGNGVCNGLNCITQFATNTITGGATGAAVPLVAQPLANGGSGYNLYAGTFDNVYYTSSTSASPSGNIYVVGNGPSGGEKLYRVPIVSNVLQAPVAVAVVNQTKPPWSSPVTEFCNNGGSACVSDGASTTAGTDRIFFSVFQGNVAGSNCNNQGAGLGCVFSYNVSTPLAANSNPIPTGSLATTAPSGNGCWVTGGIIIDNASASTGASQVYFVQLNGNSPSGAPDACTTVTSSTIRAVQVSQSALQ